MSSENVQIATTIRNQLYGIDRLAMMCIGANQFVAIERGLMFKASGAKIRRGGRAKITLNGLDLYDIEVIRVNGTSIKTVKKVENVYFDDMTTVLSDIFG